MHETFAKQTLGVSALKRIFPPKIRLVVQRELFRDLDSARCPCASFSAETCRADTIPPRSRDIAARAKGLSQCRKSPCGFHFIYISPAGPPERKIPPPPARPSVRCALPFAADRRFISRRRCSTAYQRQRELRARERYAARYN